MLFSELNRLNLNVLIQDSKYEEVPSLRISRDQKEYSNGACYVHNRDHWTLWYESIGKENDLDIVLPHENPDFNGWELRELSSVPYGQLQNTYLECALTDISNNMVLTNNVDSDVVKIYSGELSIDGTVDYESIIDNEDVFGCRGAHSEHHPLHGNKAPPFNDSWWTFSNGAFQWIGGTKSIYECRFSYGPFNDCCGGQDPHHCEDTNHKIFDDYLKLSKLYNLNFIFDKQHVLKGIVSLPCPDENSIVLTKKFIGDFLSFVENKYTNGMTFKNIDNILKEFSKTSIYFPTIRVAFGESCECPEKDDEPIEAVFELTRNPYILLPNKYKYVKPDANDFNSFFNKSIWHSFNVNPSFAITKYDYGSEISSLPLLKPEDTLWDTMEHVNQMQGVVIKLNADFDKYQKYTLLSEKKLWKSTDGFDSTAIMTLSDLFKNAKTINKMFEDDQLNDNLYSTLHIIVLPKNFCNKDILKMISNVRYV